MSKIGPQVGGRAFERPTNDLPASTNNSLEGDQRQESILKLSRFVFKFVPNFLPVSLVNRSVRVHEHGAMNNQSLAPCWLYFTHGQSVNLFGSFLKVFLVTVFNIVIKAFLSRMENVVIWLRYIEK